jgi:hypothetical protein
LFYPAEVCASFLKAALLITDCGFLSTQRALGTLFCNGLDRSYDIRSRRLQSPDNIRNR